jgi:hypothetical protein
MIGVEVIWQLPEWLVDHPQVYTYADGMLAASYPQSEAIAHLLHGTGTTELDNTTSSFLASNVQNESHAWARCWLSDDRTSPRFELEALAPSQPSFCAHCSPGSSPPRFEDFPGLLQLDYAIRHHRMDDTRNGF